MNDQKAGPLDRGNDDQGFTGLVLLASLGVFTGLAIGLSGFPLMDVDEPRFATASRHMARGERDWIVPWFNGTERFDKPALIYWLQALCIRLFGEGEFALRLPSALAVTSAIPATASIGRMLGLRAKWAVAAAVMVPLAGVVQALGRACTADALLLGVVTWTAWVQVKLFVGRERRGRHERPLQFALWTLVALLCLTKGPPAWVGTGALGVAMWLCGRRPKIGHFLLGAVLSTAAFLLWFVPAYLQSDGRFLSVGLGHHVVERASRPFEGHGGFQPWWYVFYVWAVPLVFMPWSLYLWRGLHERVRWGQRGEDGSRGTAQRLCAIWVGVTLLVFTLSTSKLPHYPVPAFPALAVWLCLGLQRAHDVGLDTRSVDRRLAWVLQGLGVVLAVVFVAIFPIAGLYVWPPSIIAGLVFALGLRRAGRCLAQGQILPSITASAITSVVGFALFTSAVMPKLQHAMVAHEIQDGLGRFPRDKVLHGYSLSMPSLVYYLDTEVYRFTNDPELPPQPVQVMQRILEPGHAVITRRSKLGDFERHFDQLADGEEAVIRRVLANPVVVGTGFLPSKGKVVDLVLLDAVE